MNFSKFHLTHFFQQKLKKWNWSVLLPAQSLLLREFRAGRPHLICAHGGSGKTSGALLALAEYLNPNKDLGLERGRAPRTLVITPGLDVAARLCLRMDTLVYPSRLNTFPARPGEDFNRKRRAAMGVDFVAGPTRLLERVGEDFGLRLDGIERIVVVYFEYFAANPEELKRLKDILGKLPDGAVKALSILSNGWSGSVVRAAKALVPDCRVFNVCASFQPPEVFERFNVVSRMNKYGYFRSDITKLPDSARILVIVPHRGRTSDFVEALSQMKIRIIPNKLSTLGWSCISRSITRGAKRRVVVATHEDLKYIPPGTFEYIFVMTGQSSPAVYERIAAIAAMRDRPGEIHSYILREDLENFVSLRIQLAADWRFVIRQKRPLNFALEFAETNEECEARREALKRITAEERLAMVWERFNSLPNEETTSIPSNKDVRLVKFPDREFEDCKPKEPHPGEAFPSPLGEALAKAEDTLKALGLEAASSAEATELMPPGPESQAPNFVAPGVTVQRVLEISALGAGKSAPEQDEPAPQKAQAESAEDAEPAEAPQARSEDVEQEVEVPAEAQNEPVETPEDAEAPHSVPETSEDGSDQDDDAEWEEDEDEDSADWEEDDAYEGDEESDESDESDEYEYADEEEADYEESEGEEAQEATSSEEDVLADAAQPHRRTLTIRSDYQPREDDEPTVTITEPLSSNTVELRAAQDRMRRAMKGGEKLTHQMVGKRGTIRQPKRRRDEAMPEMEGILSAQPGAKRSGQKKKPGRGSKEASESRRGQNATRLRKPQNSNQKRRTRLVKDVPLVPEREGFQEETLTVPLAPENFVPQDESERLPRKRREKFRKPGGPNLRTPFKKRRGPDEAEEVRTGAPAPDDIALQASPDAGLAAAAAAPAAAEKREEGANRRRKDFFKKKKTPRLAKPRSSEGFPADEGFEDDDNFGNSIHYRPRQPKKSAALPWQNAGAWGEEQPTTLSFAQTTPADDFKRTGMRSIYGNAPSVSGIKPEGGKKKFGKFRKSGNFKKKFGPRPPKKDRGE